MNKIEIEIPNDKEIDWEASTKQKQIVLKDKQLTYRDVCKKLFKNGYYYTNTYGWIMSDGFNPVFAIEPNTATTTHQLECILAKNKLANVAIYLNNGWKPNLDSDYGYGIAIGYNSNHDLIIDRCAVLCMFSSGKVIFKSEELAQKAIEILGEETVKLALEPLY
jgi:hypothetical protein